MWNIVLCLVTSTVVVAYNSGDLSPSFTLQTKLGTITGTRDNIGRTRYSKFLGIPFGTANRFEKPVAHGPFGTLQATSYGPSCPQIDLLNNVVGSEDGCLTVNVFTPKYRTSDHKLRSVMVWVNEGGFLRGQSKDYPGDILVSRHDVVVVTFNYRVSAFGFLSDGQSSLPGNYGLWDQQLALKWVKENIEDYGGNPESITLFGESAGAISITYQMISPQTPKGLFHRAITESGSAFSYQLYNFDSSIVFNTIATATSCNEAADPIACLKALSVETLLQVSAATNTNYSPSIDSEFVSPLFNLQLAQFITENYENQTNIGLGNFLDYEILSGWNSQEGLFGLGPLNAINMQATGNNISLGISGDIFKFSLNAVTAGVFSDQGGIIIGLLIQHYMNDPRPLNSDGRSTEERRLEAYTNIIGDIIFKLSSVTHLQLHSLLSSKKQYAYEYQHKRAGRGFYFEGPEWLRTGANHYDEVAYVWGAPVAPLDKCPSEITFECGQYTQQEKMLSTRMMRMWTNFAKTGVPSYDWPEFRYRGDQKYVVLDTDTSSRRFRYRGLPTKTSPRSVEHRFLLTTDTIALAANNQG